MAILKVPVTSAEHIRGPVDAPIMLVKYGEYECPCCELAHPSIRLGRRHFGSGLRFVFRHFPRSQIHPLAEPAAETAKFAGEHERFWEVHDALYEKQERLGVGLFFAVVSALKLPVAELHEAIATQKHATKTGNDFFGGVRGGVNAMPAFFINDVRDDGSFDCDTLISAIATRLRARAS
jgi:protein-disulfide isomerase